ncbi:MAG: YgjV family protein, partial [Clostridiales bacterium]|nr:YgjV family protein [Clostridiales bacterium]
AIFVVFIAVTWSGFKSALSGTAKVISTFAYGSTNFALTRVLIFITSTSWFIYNLLVKSYAGCACELLTLGSIVVSLVRYKSNKKKAAVAALSAATDPTEIAENAEVAATDSEQTDVGELDTKIEIADNTLSSSESVSLPSKTAEPRDGNEDNTETNRENNTDKLPKE